jgi:hypothetical protein
MSASCDLNVRRTCMLSKVRLFSNQAVPNGVLEEGGEWLERLPEFKAWPTSLSAKA